MRVGARRNRARGPEVRSVRRPRVFSLPGAGVGYRNPKSLGVDLGGLGPKHPLSLGNLRPDSGRRCKDFLILPGESQKPQPSGFVPIPGVGGTGSWQDVGTQCHPEDNRQVSHERHQKGFTRSLAGLLLGTRREQPTQFVLLHDSELASDQGRRGDSESLLACSSISLATR